MSVEQRLEMLENGPFNLVFHGVEADWIEEEMGDDDDFRKEILVHKMKNFIKDDVSPSSKGTTFFKSLFHFIVSDRDDPGHPAPGRVPVLGRAAHVGRGAGGGHVQEAEGQGAGAVAGEGEAEGRQGARHRGLQRQAG
jgi:hypothetical protein